MEIPPGPPLMWMPIVFAPPPWWRPPPKPGEIVGRLAMALLLGVIALPLILPFLAVDGLPFSPVAVVAVAVGASLVLSGVAVGSVAIRRRPVGRRGAVLITTCACAGCCVLLWGLYAAFALVPLEFLHGWLPFYYVVTFPIAALAAFSAGSVGLEWRGTRMLALGCGLAAEVGMYLALWLAIVVGFALGFISGGVDDPIALLGIEGIVAAVTTVLGCYVALLALVFFIGGGLFGGYLRVALERHAVSSLLSPVLPVAWSAPDTEKQRAPHM